MGELFPTPARLALLRAVERNELTGYTFYGSSVIEIYWDAAGAGGRVTASVEKMILAGWVKESSRHPVEKTLSYRLTEAGEKVLEEHGHG